MCEPEMTFSPVDTLCTALDTTKRKMHYSKLGLVLPVVVLNASRSHVAVTGDSQTAKRKLSLDRDSEGRRKERRICAW